LVGRSEGTEKEIRKEGSRAPVDGCGVVVAAGGLKGLKRRHGSHLRKKGLMHTNGDGEDANTRAEIAKGEREFQERRTEVPLLPSEK
jgi:hypothetical protein